MIPYYPQPIFHAGRITITSFSALGALAVAVSGWTILKRGCSKGIPADPMFRMWFWMTLCAGAGAIGVHQAARGSLGLSSIGAVAGGMLGGLLWIRYHRLSGFEAFRRIEVVAYTLPLTGAIGRLGCALAHDHRGIASMNWFAVQFPEGPRFDLGLLEFLYLGLLAVLFRMLDRKARPDGFFLFLLAASYALCRLWIDTLRVDSTYADAAATGVIALAAGLVFHRLRISRIPAG